MGINPIDAENMIRRLDRNMVREPVKVTLPESGCDSELKLHRDIIDFCDGQFPRWKYYHARTDKKSTLEVGCADFTIFAPGKVYVVEAKKAGGKLSEEQRNWICEMKLLGHTVFVIYDFSSFLEIVNGQTP